MKVLVACERSGVVRDAFRAKGHDAWSCDLEETRAPGPHIRGNVLNHLNDGWDLMIAHPECRYLCNSAVQFLKTEIGRWEKMEKAAEFFLNLWDADIELKCLENSIMHGYAKERIRGMEQTQTIQPYNFGEDASKGTCLWLDGLPKLENTEYFPPKIIEYNGRMAKRWGNQSPSGANNIGPGPDRSERRAQTFLGIANAFADQWGGGQYRQTSFYFKRAVA